MTGLKSGAGDDLWGDDSEDDGSSGEPAQPAESGEMTDGVGRAERASKSELESESETKMKTETETDTKTASATTESATTGPQPYIVRRAIQDKSVQFERDERLTFFVHDDVIDGERDLLSDLESALGRDVPKFDVREAVYRAALRNKDDVLEELLEMGYAMDDESSE